MRQIECNYMSATLAHVYTIHTIEQAQGKYPIAKSLHSLASKPFLL